MIESRLYVFINGNERTFVGKGKNTDEADRNARRKLTRYMDTNLDVASFEDNKLEILDQTFTDEKGKIATLADSILLLPVEVITAMA
jgi:hypothetical protein